MSWRSELDSAQGDGEEPIRSIHRRLETVERSLGELRSEFNARLVMLVAEIGELAGMLAEVDAVSTSDAVLPEPMVASAAVASAAVAFSALAPDVPTVPTIAEDPFFQHEVRSAAGRDPVLAALLADEPKREAEPELPEPEPEPSPLGVHDVSTAPADGPTAVGAVSEQTELSLDAILDTEFADYRREAGPVPTEPSTTDGVAETSRPDLGSMPQGDTDTGDFFRRPS